MSTETLEHCIICKSNSHSEHLRCKDYFVSGESFTISVCNVCGFCFTNPRPGINDIGKYYESTDYVSHSKTSQGLTNRLFHLARSYTLRSKKNTLNKHASGHSILDYGCGTGEFLNKMNKSGWACVGIEPNENARNHAIKAYGLNIVGEDALEGIDAESLDTISLWHVLEHIYPLEERIRSFHKILKKDGTLIVAVPNMNSFDAKKYKEYWAAYDLPRHIYHFSPDSISALMKIYGFKLQATKSMPLDSFYISMLSEKYNHGSTKIFNAIINGLRSNISAFFKDGNYSSLIYIFKKSE